MPFQMRFRMLSTLLLSLIVPAGSASADMRFNFENCYNLIFLMRKAATWQISILYPINFKAHLYPSK